MDVISHVFYIEDFNLSKVIINASLFEISIDNIQQLAISLNRELLHIERHISEDPHLFRPYKHQRKLYVNIYKSSHVIPEVVFTVIYILGQLCDRCNLTLTYIFLSSDEKQEEITEKPYVFIFYKDGIKDNISEIIEMNKDKIIRLKRNIIRLKNLIT